MTKHSAMVEVQDTIITKRFKKKDDQSFVKFIRELSVYTVANKKKLDYIPRMISYDFKKRSITTDRINGFDLGTIPESNYEEREKYLPQIHDLLKRLKKDLLLYHNDILYRNFVFNPKTKKLYIIDFESVSIEKTSHEKKDWIEYKLEEEKKKKKTNKKTKKTAKNYLNK